MSRFFIFVILITCSVRAHALDLAELHQFTDKKGNEITANLLEISPDRKNVKIRRVDGVVFDTEILLFSLDDQQYLKDWISAKALASNGENAMPEFHLEVNVDHKDEGTTKHASGSLGLESTPHFFEIKISNTSRETLVGAVVEYVILWEESITVYEDKDDGEWTYTSRSSDERGSVMKKQGITPLEDIAFNRDVIVMTETADIEQAIYSDGDILREDHLLGALVRVVGADGQLLAETTTGKGELDGYTWEKTLALNSTEVDED